MQAQFGAVGERHFAFAVLLGCSAPKKEASSPPRRSAVRRYLTFAFLNFSTFKCKGCGLDLVLEMRVRLSSKTIFA